MVLYLQSPKVCTVKTNSLTGWGEFIISQSSFLLFQNQTCFLPRPPSTVFSLSDHTTSTQVSMAYTDDTLDLFCIHSQHPGPVTFLPPLEWGNCISGVFITPVQTLILMVLTCPCPGWSVSILRPTDLFSSSLCPYYLSYCSAHSTFSISICRDICLVNLEKQSHEKPERCLQIFLFF